MNRPVAKPARHLVVQMQIQIIIITHFYRNWFLIRSINPEKFAFAWPNVGLASPLEQALFYWQKPYVTSSDVSQGNCWLDFIQ